MTSQPTRSAPEPGSDTHAGPDTLLWRAELPDEDRARLLADVARAATIIAPSWPLSSFVAVNPLGGLQHRTFDEAAETAQRWLGARTHLSLAEHRRLHAQGTITDADLRRAIIEVLPELLDPTVVWSGFHADPAADTLHDVADLAATTIDAVEVVRLDLLVGPDAPVVPRPTLGGLDETRATAVDELVAGWCAAYVDAEVAWAMPHRDHGFYAAWRRFAAADRGLRRLVTDEAHALLTALPEQPLHALAGALDLLGTVPDDHLDAMRALLGRLPGWAGYARWCDDWAPAAHPATRLALVELLSVLACTTALAATPVTPAAWRGDTDRVAASLGGVSAAPSTIDHLDADAEAALLGPRVDAVLDALGRGHEATDAVRDVLEHVPPMTRSAIWLEAREANLRDRLLGLLTRLDPGAPTDRPDVQIACCIDVRSEGLRRHLEALGPTETLGYAGFFGVPLSWRPLGAPRAEPRCPVLVTPRHEVAEGPAPDTDARRYLAAQRTAAANHAAFHAAKGDLTAPFALAEASGWLLGPLAAARTLAPELTDRVAGRLRSVVAPPRTEPAVAATDPGGTGMALEERALFAEAIVTTLGARRFARLVVLCGHGSATVNNPHASAYDCGACGGAPGGASARTAAAILNDPQVRDALAERGRALPDDTWFVAAQHDTVTDEVHLLDRDLVPAGHQPILARFEQDLATAGDQLSRERAARLPGRARSVRKRGRDWAQIRPEWGLAGNAAFVVGPRSITAELDLACRVFLHSYDAETDTDGHVLETIMTAPLVVAQWINAQYYFSTVDPDVFGAGDKLLHNPVGGVGVVLGDGGDLQVGLPAQAVAVGDDRRHEPVRLLAVVQAPLERTEGIIQRNQVLRELVSGRWLTVAGRSDGDERWSIRSPRGTWSTWFPADEGADQACGSLEIR